MSVTLFRQSGARHGYDKTVMMKSPADVKRSETPVRWIEKLGSIKMQRAFARLR